MLELLRWVITGSALTVLISVLRDRAVRKDAKLSALREMNLKIDDLYRSTKQIRRVIRARLNRPCNNDVNALPVYNIQAKFFCEQMDALSNA